MQFYLDGRPVSRLWIRSAEVRGGGGKSLGECENNNNNNNMQFYFILSSEFNAYLKEIKMILFTVKKYRIFSLVTNTIYIFPCSKPRLFRQFRV